MALTAYVCLLLALSHTAAAAIVQRTLVLTEAFIAPDGCDRRAILINGRFVGPVIRVKQGDELRVTVVNMLNARGAAIHWHGLSPIDPWVDGSGEVAQCYIQRGTYQYRFVVETHPGTYWYHGHAAMERIDGLYGALIVEPASPALPATATLAEKLIANTSGDFAVLLADWSHINSEDQTAALDTDTLARVGILVPAVVLVNGKANPGPDFIASDPTCVNESTIEPAAPSPTFEVFSVEKGKSYYYRIVNAGSFSYLSVQFQGHKMTVVSADGQYIQPFETTTLHLNIGQRYGVIVTASEVADSYWISVDSEYVPPPPASGAAILHYIGSGAPQDWAASAPPPPVIPQDLSYDPRAYRGALPLPADMTALEPDAEILLDGYFDPEFRWSLNGTIFDFTPSGTPLLNYAYSGKIGELQGTPSGPVAVFPLGKVVDVIFENKPLINGFVTEHAWHIHGHNFYVLGFGPGKFDRQKHASLLNFKDPVRRDVVTLYPFGTMFGGSDGFLNVDPNTYGNVSVGWTVVRLKTEYPGAWLMHCHIAPHQYARMVAYFVTHPDAIPAPPAGMPECGNIEQLETPGKVGPQFCADGQLAVPKWGTCGGKYYKGPTCCVAGSYCHYMSEWYSQCK